MPYDGLHDVVCLDSPARRNYLIIFMYWPYQVFLGAGFGTLKRKCKLTKVGCLDDIAKVIDQSASMNHPQLVGDQQGNVIVPVYDFFKNWTIKNVDQEDGPF